MSINHFSSDIPETLWWTHQQQQQTPVMEPPNPNSPSSNHNKLLIPQQTNLYDPHHHIWLGSLNSQEAAVAAASASMFRHRNTSLNFNLNQEDNEEQVDEQIPDVERESMFEKPLTPSDVGKLNRLVIPKQHAEKYFPLGGDSGDKGLLLSFEDESGKYWRFRYSYWNSSQSYVLTKGWSRYVKEKRLDAGDVVLFERHRTDGDRLFIGWRRRAAPAPDSGAAQPPVINTTTTNTNTTTTTTTTTGGWTRVFYSAHPYPSHPLPYQPDCLHAGSVNVGQNETTPTGNSKRLRLFGVNMECQLDESEPATPDGSSSSSQGQNPHHHQFYPETPGSSGHSLNMQDINLPRDVNLMRNRRG